MDFALLSTVPLYRIVTVSLLDRNRWASYLV